MLNPVGAIYDFAMWLINNWERIVQIIQNIVSSVGKIAMGMLGEAAKFIENTLANFIPLLLDFMARMLRLGNVSARIKRILAKLRKPLDDLIAKVMAFIRKKIKQGAKKAKETGQNVKEALGDWWKQKRKIKTERGENHTLYFKGKGSNAKLMVASRPKTFKDFIKDIQAPTQHTKVKARAQSTAGQIDRLIKKRRTSNTTNQAQIPDLMDKLANDLRILADLDSSNSPPSVIKYSPLTPDGGATFADAQILSDNHVEGSTPKDKPDHWNKANRRRPAGSFIRGHLINHHIGGPGYAYNLTPITGKMTTDANGNHEKYFERHIKPVVLTEKKVIRYRVEAVYGKHPRRNFEETLRNRIGTPNEQTDDRYKLEIMEYERNYLPKFLKITWAILKNENGRWVDDKVKIGGQVKNQLPDGDFAFQRFP
ncbi:DNA/RNA non-specific endonuclease [Microscilla marina]|uniref:Type VII secretion system protein EssD-like domain-containing protein n=1 Tax=Microscilla marina ATCC 23134 TaxID=313606 RepID=A1ZZZ8_MICM2|nr:DNA/RNA non-specific endonuclease [Microscilla marina]EAY24040.1 conserved hypothetical protein [Microscilla marina ATCC 23134]